MIKKKFSSVISCALFAYAAMGMQGAQAAIDQSQLSANIGVPFAFSFTSTTDYPLGQSFTAGLSGTLSNIMLGSNGQIQGGGNTVTLEIRDGNGVAGALLGSKTLDVSSVWTPSVGHWVFDMDVASLGIGVQSGHAYTFDVTSVSGSGDLAYRGVLGSTENPYTKGRIYTGAAYGNQPNWDLVFRTSVTAVPEAETYGMLLAGLGIIGFLSRRRKVEI